MCNRNFLFYRVFRVARKSNRDEEKTSHMEEFPSPVVLKRLCRKKISVHLQVALPPLLLEL